MSVCRERVDGVWINTYFKDIKQAKKLMMKILRSGGVAIALRSAV